MIKCIPGQRWLSEMEPEIGLGEVVTVERRRVHIHFPAGDITRIYSIDTAPIKRVRYRAGDRIKSRDGRSLIVELVTEENGLLTYCGQDLALSEIHLCDTTSFSTPEERLHGGQLDFSSAFDLRMEALYHQHHVRRSAIRGFSGGRIDLIPHQFFIAGEIASRPVPRALLADEVGLGKTIEACLVIHRLLISGRIGRVLILVPESLIHQWFVELLRRFNLIFRIVDEPFCRAAEAAGPTNPFLDDQLALAGIDFLSGSRLRMTQAIEAGWDMLIVDEAHRLKEKSPAHGLVAALAHRIPGLLLLTATPEQMGQRSHFSRLNLLDPKRFFDFDTFLDETNHYREIAGIAAKLIENKPLTAADRHIIRSILPAEASRPLHENDQRNPTSDVIDLLIDRHGLGRAMFRNTREVITGFPRRIAHLIERSGSTDKQAALTKKLTLEFQAESDGLPVAGGFDFSDDPRLDCLVELLREIGDEKLLLICRSREKAEAIATALRGKLRIDAALFHEKMTLLQRDRNAAWFAEKDGARLLICSEIGSEGRNFQFAHHLMLFDLPPDPELLEQRIGRLDRIGQSQPIHIHVPYVTGSPMEVLARWYHEGLNAFEACLPGALKIMEQFGSRVDKLAKAWPGEREQLNGLIQDTRRFRIDLVDQLKAGRDRLLELNSFRPGVADDLIRAVQSSDHCMDLDRFMDRIFDHFGVEVEELSHRTIRLSPGLRFNEAFPWIKNKKMAVTFDRQTAIHREDIVFLSWDHPMVTGAMELLLGSPEGNCAFALWPKAKSPALLLEAVFVLESVAPAALFIDRFLPPTPIRVVVDHHRHDLSQEFTRELFSNSLQNGSPRLLREQPELLRILFPGMMKSSEALAEKQTASIIESAGKKMEKMLNKEIRRLEALQTVNPSIQPGEIEVAKQEIRHLDKHISSARLRLDALRLIWAGPLPT